MNWFLELADRHWFLALMLILALKFPFIIVNRIIRSINLAFHGWPPSHLDADGDWRKES